jgi:hypothetical protein
MAAEVPELATEETAVISAIWVPVPIAHDPVQRVGAAQVGGPGCVGPHGDNCAVGGQ